MSRHLLIVAASSIALAAGACVAPESKQCGADGPICPKGWVCIEDLSACIDPVTTLCGNGVKDQGEDCDDGDLENHDGCNWDCRFPRCGDRLIDTYEKDGAQFTEVCDDGIDTSTGEPRGGDGCSAGCDSKEVCGDGKLNDYLHLARDEQGNLTSETVPAEQCDDLGVDTTACNKDCTIAGCGDGKINSARNEECDPNTGTSSSNPGLALNHSTTCNIDCTDASCGDGQKNTVRGEQCDLGSFCANGATCTTAADCPGGLSDQLCIPRDVDCCTAGCQDARCGDRVVQRLACGELPPETCDDGKYCLDGTRCTVDSDCPGAGSGRCATRNNAACSLDCQSVGECGDGHLNDYPPFNEVCDDGKHCADGTECTNDLGCAEVLGADKVCKKRDTADCNATCKSTGVCGDGIINAYAPYLEICDDGRRCTDGTPCDANNPCATGLCEKREGFGCSLNCKSVEVCGDGIRNNYAHPMVALGKWRGRSVTIEGLPTTQYDIESGTAIVDSEACDDGKHCSDADHTECDDDADCAGLEGDGLCKPRSGDGCSQDCLSVERCGDGYLSDYAGVTAEGTPRVAELCDDSNNNDNDGCNPTCSSSGVCGNAILDPGEECDYGLSFNGIGAPPPAESPFCLPGAVGGQQACTFPCSAQCGLRQCGNGRRDTGEACDDGKHCLGTSTSCTKDADCPGTAVGRCQQRNTDNCTNDCSVNGCGDGVPNLIGGTSGLEPGTAAQPIQACDTGGVNTLTCNFNCTVPACGDKDGTNTPIVNFPFGETCDNGPGLVAGQTMESSLCNTNCRLAFCGDAVTNASRNEVCDDGNNSDGDGCAGSCTSIETCGDGVANRYLITVRDALGTVIEIRPPEVCDNGGGCSNLGKVCVTDADCANVTGACQATGCTNIPRPCTNDSQCPGGACEARGGDGCSDDCQSLETCGDRYLSNYPPYDETCDDGSDVNGDGCDANCSIEIGWSCPTREIVLAGGEVSYETTDFCFEVCGDRLVVGGETCDDDDDVGGDGCSATCRIERGWRCPVTGIDGGECTPICGDREIWGSEQCDDGNLTDDDGCDSNCQREPGFTCPGVTGGEGGICQSVCGDNLIRGFEECDDGDLNTPVSLDGCDSNCRLELGWSCPVRGAGNEGQNCTAVCGDFVIRGAEQCDDGLQCANGAACITSANCTAVPGPDKTCAVRAGDGCSATCQREPGWSCPAGMEIIGGECVAVCGDNLTRGSEQCDNGKACANGVTCTADANCSAVPGVDKTCRPRPSDGCDAACQVEAGWTCVVTGGVTTSCTPGCGDGRVLGNETCDDGNQNPGDGCSNSCQTETGWRCDQPGQLCLPICGDGLVRANARYTETCDDHDTDPNDGCDPQCKVEVGWTCDISNPQVPSPCDEICGDARKVGDEQCDDNNQNSGDGCSNGCNIETGWRCPDLGLLCLPICGDSRIRSNARYTETCDDGGLVNFDGCNTECKVETGWTCDASNPNAVSPCDEICGDALKVGDEQCDDDNEVPNDGCSAGCTIEVGWTCPDVGQLCLPICGDQRVRANARFTEQCDNAVGNFDGCDTSCQVETGWTCDASNPNVSTPCDETCGDGLKVGAEQCDDDNDDAFDGCSDVCTIETGFTCPDVGQFCLPTCGDGVRGVNPRATEQCDDNDLESGDGCDSGCRIETGWTCTGALGGLSSCAPTCGDSLVRGAEQCDDGKTCALGASCTEDANCTGQGDGLCRARALDGCTDTCVRETGWTCPVQGGACQPNCGDGNLLGIEECDDHNNDNGDGCDSGCREEPGWTCTNTNNSVCTTVCFDGIIRGAETCDEGAATPSGGCTSCQRNDGWSCPNVAGVGGVCTAICGDSKVRGPENCDDGNNAAGDGCSNLCLQETGWTCANNAGVGGACVTNCGDGFVRGTETCDEGSTPSNGGCNVSCQRQTGWTCPTAGGNGGTCFATCGDFLLRDQENCDDGNQNTGDGCNDSCQNEGIAHWACPSLAGVGGLCVPICGSGQINGTENCDDGNTFAGDGCDSQCKKEAGWTCATAGQLCTADCGDGLIRGAETCDEGPVSGDSVPNTAGCLSCQRQIGWTCPTVLVNNSLVQQVSCSTICGDGLVRGGETCDEGTSVPSTYPGTGAPGCTSCVASSLFNCREPGRTCVVRPVLVNDAFTVLTGSPSYTFTQLSMTANDQHFQTGSMQVVTPSVSCGATVAVSGNDVTYTPLVSPLCTPPTGSLWQDTFSYSLAAPADALVRESAVTTVTINRPPTLTANQFTCVPVNTANRTLDVGPIYTDPDGNVINQSTITGTSANGSASRTGTVLTYTPTSASTPLRHIITVQAQDTSPAPGTAQTTWTAVWNDPPTLSAVAPTTRARGLTATFDFVANGTGLTDIGVTNGVPNTGDINVDVTVSATENGTFAASADVLTGGSVNIGTCVVTNDLVTFTASNTGIGSGSCWVKVCEPCGSGEGTCSKRELQFTVVTCQDSTDDGTDDGCQSPVETGKPICDTTTPSAPFCRAGAQPGDNTWYHLAGQTPVVARADLLANDGVINRDYKPNSFRLSAGSPNSQTTACGSVAYVGGGTDTVTYTRTNSSCFSDSFTYDVADQGNTFRTAIVSIIVNRAPTIDDRFVCVESGRDTFSIDLTAALPPVYAQPAFSDPDSHALLVSSIVLSAISAGHGTSGNGVNPVVFNAVPDNSVGTFSLTVTAKDTLPLQTLTTTGFIVPATANGSDSAVFTYRWNDKPVLTNPGPTTRARTGTAQFNFAVGALTSMGTVNGVADTGDTNVDVTVSSNGVSYGAGPVNVMDGLTNIGSCSLSGDVVTFTAGATNTGTGSCFVKVCEPCANAPGGAVCETTELTFTVITCTDDQTGLLATDLGCGGSTPICDDAAPPDEVPLCVACEVDGNCGGGNPGWTCVSNVCVPPPNVSAVNDNIKFLLNDLPDRDYLASIFLSNDANADADTFTLPAQTNCGAVSLTNAGAAATWFVTYTPPLDASLCTTPFQDTFTYSVCNVFDDQDCDVGTVTVMLNRAPTLADSYSCVAHTGQTVLSRDVSVDYTDPELHPIGTVTFIGSPADTQVTGTTVQYTRSTTGPESFPFTIQACEDHDDPFAEGCDQATWTALFNDGPTLASPTIAAVVGVQVTVPLNQFVTNWGSVQVPFGSPLAEISVDSGTCTINGSNNVLFTPSAVGSPTCVIEVCETCGASPICATTTITFDVDLVEDDTVGYWLDDPEPLLLPFSVVFANDGAVDPATMIETDDTTSCGGLFEIDGATDTITYVAPDAPQSCTIPYRDTFTYTVCALYSGVVCEPATVTVVLNRSPAFSAASSCVATGTASTTLDVSTRYSDPDGNALDVPELEADNPGGGTVAFSGSILTLTPTTPASATTYNVLYLGCDNGLAPGCAFGDWTVVYNDAPIALDQTVEALKSTTKTFATASYVNLGTVVRSHAVTFSDDEGGPFTEFTSFCSMSGNDIAVDVADTSGTTVECYFEVCESCGAGQCDIGHITVTSVNCFDNTVGGTDTGCTNPASPACFESTTHDCVECTVNADCTDTPSTAYCSAGRTCVECIGDGDCTGGDTCESGVCTPP